MEKFGWPMGPRPCPTWVASTPATMARDVMAEGLPGPLAVEGKTAVDVMYREANRLGQKNGRALPPTRPTSAEAEEGHRSAGLRSARSRSWSSSAK